MKEIIAQIITACQPYWAFRDNAVHIPESTRFARMLLQAIPAADADIVLPAILMHDNGYAKVPPETLYAGLKDAPVGFRADVTRLHEIEGAKIARDILESIRYPEEKIVEICQIIDGHDSREEALSLNDQLVKDADKLWRYTVSATNIAGRGWMKLTPEKFNTYVTERIDKWLFTDAAKAIARQTTQDTAHQLKHPLEGVAFMLVRDGQLLVEKRRPDKRLLPNVVSIPGGHSESGEKPEETLRRELKEELNLVPEHFRFVCTLLSWAQEFRKLHYFMVDAWSGEMEMLEAADLRWIDIEEIEQLDIDVDRLAVQEMRRVYG